jgi:hypothetical protein
MVTSSSLETMSNSHTFRLDQLFVWVKVIVGTLVLGELEVDSDYFTFLRSFG